MAGYRSPLAGGRWHSPKSDQRVREGEQMTYTIEETGLGGWMSYRYQYNAGTIDRFGYAETQEEAEKAIKEGASK